MSYVIHMVLIHGWARHHGTALRIRRDCTGRSEKNDPGAHGSSAEGIAQPDVAARRNRSGTTMSKP